MLKKPPKKARGNASTKRKTLSQEELSVINALGEFENKKGNNVGMAPPDLGQEAQLTWSKLRPVLKSLDKKRLIEMHKGLNYTSYWMRVELGDEPGSLYRNNFNPIWRFRLTDRYRILYAKPLKRTKKRRRRKVKKRKKIPGDLITLLVAKDRYHVSRITLKRHIAKGDLKSYRQINAVKNTPHRVSEAEVASYWPKKAKPG